MRARLFALLITALALVGCDRITGAGQQKILDAEAVGYSCRVSQKLPEDCMKENETKSPTSILDGWKAADKDIEANTIFLVHQAAQTAIRAQSAPVATTAPAEAEQAAAKKPAEAPAKPGSAEAEKKPSH